MNLDNLELWTQRWRERLALLRKIESELRDGFELSVYFYPSEEARVSNGDPHSALSLDIAELTEDSFAEYRVPPFHFTGETTHGETFESTDLNAALVMLTENTFDAVDLTVNGRTYEFRRGHGYVVQGDTFAFKKSPCYAARAIVNVLRHGGRVKFADLGHIDSIDMETIEL